MATARKTTSSAPSEEPDEGGSSSRATKKSAPARKRAPAKKGASAKKSVPAKRSGSAKAESSPTASAPSKKVPAMKVARVAARQLAELTGRAPECVIGIDRNDDGWEVDLEVVESRRIPDSTDVLAIYRVQTDEEGDLTGYHRVRRYIRGKSGDGDGGPR